MNTLVLLAFAAVAAVCHAENILMLQPIPRAGHYKLMERLAIRLTHRGHKVTLLAPFNQTRDIPNLTDVELDNVYDKIMAIVHGTTKDRTIKKYYATPLKSLFRVSWIGQMLSENLLKSPSMRNFLEKDHKFDVLITNNFLTESLYGGLAYKYRLPIVVVASTPAIYWDNYLVGNPATTAFVPEPFLGYSDSMNFFQRLHNTFIYYLQVLHLHLSHLSSHDSILKRYFGPETPHVYDIVKNTSLVLVNSHFTIGNPKPYLPSMAEIGGIHFPQPAPLPEDLKKIMDESQHGVILFSLGSHIKSSYLPKTKLQMLVNTFSRLNQTVLWKFENNTMQNLPPNVVVRRWLPQFDILAHPNLKVFITHGGIHSTAEALHFGVPMVGVPVMNDQSYHMKHAAEAGYAISLSMMKLDEEGLYAALTEVLTNPKYTENAKRKSIIPRDRPMHPADTAAYWIEYVLRHKGATHLRSSAQNLTWYQIHSFDIFAVFFSLMFTTLLVVYLIVRLLLVVFRFFTGRRRSFTPKKWN